MRLDELPSAGWLRQAARAYLLAGGSINKFTRNALAIQLTSGFECGFSAEAAGHVAAYWFRVGLL